MPLTLSPTLELDDGLAIPRLGLGVYQSGVGEETYQAVRWALEAGYRHIDTAAVYRNEADVGRAIKDSGVPRGEVFVTTKLWNQEQGYESTLKAYDGSLERLGLDYVDLYLLHFPVPGLRQDSWRACEKLYADGRVRAIGVSNFTVKHLEELLKTTTTVPMVNQVEFSPFLYQQALLAYCQKHAIALEAYSPLTQGVRLSHPTIVALAEKYGRTPAQIMIRWVLEHDMIVIPKSVTQHRIVENFDVFGFAIAPEDMATLDALDEGLRVCWDPSDTP